MNTESNRATTRNLASPSHYPATQTQKTSANKFQSKPSDLKQRCTDMILSQTKS